MKEILISCGIIQKSAVVLEDNELKDIFVEHSSHKEATVGSIYKGIVDNIVSGMQSAFIDIGLDKNAFLFFEQKT